MATIHVERENAQKTVGVRPSGGAIGIQIGNGKEVKKVSEVEKVSVGTRDSSDNGKSSFFPKPPPVLMGAGGAHTMPKPPRQVVDDDTLDLLANPEKRVAETEPDTGMGLFSGIMQRKDEESDVSSLGVSRGGGSDYSSSGSELMAADPPPVVNNAYSEFDGLSYEQIQGKKAYYLNKLTRAQKDGAQLSRKFTMVDNLEDIKGEHTRLKKQRNIEEGIKWARGSVLTLAAGIEKLNNTKLFEKVRMQLDGWSESVAENIDDYNDVLEELIEKYIEVSGFDNVPPELRFILMFGGSAVWFHMSKKMFGQGKQNVIEQVASDPQLLQALAAEMIKQQPPQQPQPQQRPVQPPQIQPVDGFGRTFMPNRTTEPNLAPRPQPAQPVARANPTVQQQRPEMRGPANVDSILQKLRAKNQGNVKADSSSSSSESESSSSSESEKEQPMKEVKVPARGRGGLRGRGARGGTTRGGKTRGN